MEDWDGWQQTRRWLLWKLLEERYPSYIGIHSLVKMRGVLCTAHLVRINSAYRFLVLCVFKTREPYLFLIGASCCRSRNLETGQ
jgi:hypothetical protein